MRSRSCIYALTPLGRVDSTYLIISFELSHYCRNFHCCLYDFLPENKKVLQVKNCYHANFFTGDGMSLATIMAARTFSGQLERGLGEESILDFESFPVTGLARVSVYITCPYPTNWSQLSV